MQTIIVLLNPGKLENPDMDLRYSVPDRESTLEKVGFSLIKTEMYQDMHDESKCMTNFYELVL